MERKSARPSAQTQQPEVGDTAIRRLFRIDWNKLGIDRWEPTLKRKLKPNRSASNEDE